MTTTHKLLLLLLVILLIAGHADAQVGINTSSPNLMSELDITNVVSGNDTIPKGILIPRMSKVKRDQLNVSEPQYANGLLIYNTDEDCYNFFQRKNKRWKSMCNDNYQSEIQVVDCNAIDVKGVYVVGRPTSTANYIKIALRVERAGKYTITAMPDVYNGYYFNGSGEFLTAGDFYINVPAAGTPTMGGGHTFVVSINGKPTTCTFDVDVAAFEIDYAINCASITVLGEYKVDNIMNAGNYAEIEITASSLSVGRPYLLETNIVNGVRFSGSGTLVAGTQIIQLSATGVPVKVGKSTFALSTNSTVSSVTCDFDMMVIKKMRILTFGSTAHYGYNFSVSNSQSGNGRGNGNAFITDTRNFGPNGIVKCDNFELIDGKYTVNVTQLNTWLTGSNLVDIVIIGYDINITAAAAAVIAGYINNGGVVLSYCETAPQVLINAVFGTNVGTAGAGGSGTVKMFKNIVGDPVLNGPFGDVTNKYWGEDASSTISIPSDPTIVSNSIIYSDGTYITTGGAAAGDASRITALRHKTKNFIWVGDGGFNSQGGAPSDITSTTICPFLLDSNNKPIAKTNFVRPVYNSTFTGNALAWAIEQVYNKGN